MSHHPAAIRFPHYFGDEGTWTERGPVGVVEPMPNPPWIGTTEIYTQAVGLEYIRTMIYAEPSIYPNGIAPWYNPPGEAGIGPYGQPLSPEVGTVAFFGSGG